MRGECRKTSADKEPTTDSNTLGGSDHVRIYGLPPLPPTSGFVSMCYPSAYGKVPHVVAERDLHGWGFQRRVARYEILDMVRLYEVMKHSIREGAKM